MIPRRRTMMGHKETMPAITDWDLTWNYTSGQTPKDAANITFSGTTNCTGEMVASGYQLTSVGSASLAQLIFPTNHAENCIMECRFLRPTQTVQNENAGTFLELCDEQYVFRVIVRQGAIYVANTSSATSNLVQIGTINTKNASTIRLVKTGTNGKVYWNGNLLFDDTLVYTASVLNKIADKHGGYTLIKEIRFKEVL